MAYIIQQRRDTKDNWEKVNPVLADAEIGFIKDLGEELKQKSSLFKIGDGKTAWNDLPLFGWGGTFYNANDAWKGSDLDTSIASQQAVLDKIAEKILASETGTNATIEEVRTALEETFNVSIAELDKKYNEIIYGTAEYTDEETGEFFPAVPGIESRLADTESKVGTYIISNDAAIQSLNELTKGHTDTLGSHTTSIEEHHKEIYGWDEEVENTDPETGEPITETVHHNSIDENIDAVDAKLTGEISRVEQKFDSMHQIKTEAEYEEILDFSSYADGTLIFTYKEEEE
jgi:hypothetical protein